MMTPVVRIAVSMMAMRMPAANIDLHMLTTMMTGAIRTVMAVRMAGGAGVGTGLPAFSPISVAARRTFCPVQMRHRAKRRETLVIGIRRLNFLAIGDRTGRGSERRGEKPDAREGEHRYGASKILHPLSVAPVLL